jgi:hypothetical protein
MARYSGGQTGTIDSGQIHEDPVPNYLSSGAARASYLTVVDAQPGGVLTGRNSAGARLIAQLKREMKKIIPGNRHPPSSQA